MKLYYYLFTAFFLLFSFISIAQTRVYYNNGDEITTKELATNYRIYTLQADRRYKLDEYKIPGDKLRRTGYCLTPDSASDNGYFIVYDDSGLVFYEGEYINNKQQGTFKYYYENSKQIWHTDDMYAGKLNGVLKSYYISGKLKRIENYINDSSTGGKCYSEDGKEIKFTSFNSGPSCTSNISEYIKANLHYPATAKNKAVEGTIRAYFLINEDGSVSGIGLYNSLGSACDKEAMRLLKNMPPWNPSTEDDKNAASGMVVEIPFKL